MKKNKLKNKKINKSYNIFKKIKGCFECHKIIKNKLNKINKKNIKKNYKNIKDFKNNLKYNFNMNKIIKNIKNNYIIEICKYLKIISKLKIKKCL